MIAATYTYDEARTDIVDLRPAHREYLKVLFDDGRLLASGPWGENGALLIFASDSLDEVRVMIDRDPFSEAGIVTESVIKPWTMVYGPW